MKFTMILGSAAALVLASATATSAAPTGPASVSPAIVAVSAPLALTAVQQTATPPKADIKVDIDSSPNTVWYADPVWIAVGAIALLIVIVLAVMASRGGSDRTTVVR